MTETIIRQLTPSVWIFSRPFKRFGFLPVGGRSTAIKLANGDVWVLASTTLDKSTKEKIDEMGSVRYIVAGNTEHNLFLGEFKTAYPHAKLIGTEPLVAKRNDLKFDGAYGKDPVGTKYGYEPEIQACYFPETGNNEMAFFHAESKSLLEADLLINLKPPFGVGPYSAFHKTLAKWNTKDAKATREHAKFVAGWDFDRIIPCHGDVVETGGKEAWKSVFGAFLN